MHRKSTLGLAAGHSSSVQCSAVRQLSADGISVAGGKDVMFGFHLMCGLMVIGILVFALDECRNV